MITKQTGVSIGLMIVIVTVAYKLGGARTDIDFIATRVQAIEVDRVKSKDNYNTFQIEVVQRLSRIEQEIKKIPKGGN